MKSDSLPPCSLPRRDESWQADVGNLVGEDDYPLWLVWITCPDWDLILAHTISENEPASDVLWTTMLQAMQYPLPLEPHRPSRLLVRHQEHWRWKPLKTALAKIGIALVPTDDFDTVDGIPELIDEVFVNWLKKNGSEQ